MRTKIASITSKLLLIALTAALGICVAACGKDDTAAPVVSDVTLAAAAGETLGAVENEHRLTYTATEGSDITVTVQKDGAPATDAEYTYTHSTGIIVFHVTGEFTVTVLAEKDGRSDEGAVTLRIGAYAAAPAGSAPVITLRWSDDTNAAKIEEGSVLPLTARVAFAAGDTQTASDWQVSKFDGERFAPVEQAAGVYEWQHGHAVFRPLAPGLYRITLSAQSESGSSHKTVGVEACAARLSLALSDEVALTNGRVRLLTATSSGIAYTVRNAAGNGEAYLGNYDVRIEKDDPAVTVEKAEEDTVLRVSSQTDSTALVTVTYAHRTVADAVYSLSVPVGFVSDLENAPAFGADPFGGTCDTLLPSTGLVLYHNVTAADGRPLSYADVQYEVIDSSLTRAKQTNGQSTLVAKVYADVRGNTNYPFVLVEDFENNTSSGTVTVRLTATSNGVSASAVKVFTVTPLSSNVTGKFDDAAGLNNYISQVYDIGATDYDVITSGNNRQNMVVGKEGLIVNRAWGGGDIVCVQPNGADNFRLDFRYTVLNRLDVNADTKNKASFSVHFRTGKFEGWNSNQTAFYAENSDQTITAGYWGAGDTVWSNEKPEVRIGTPLHVRLTHTVTDGAVRYLWQWSYDGETYTDWISYSMATSGNAGDIGAPVYALQFIHEAGCYLLGGMTLTLL
ncbi:MAG: hypothetical protein HFE46_01740 [Clostridia bacterium]|jgi:hypothetical protein|nr:hypothetical protein [Clostridia bacterium]